MTEQTNKFNGLEFSQTLPDKPGVYKMMGVSGVLYVGKAKNLKKRVGSYFQNEQHGRIKAIVRRVEGIDFTVVESEIDALVLESKIIRDEKPKYNIALKEGKGYPYVFISSHPIPRIDVRYDKKEKGEYFGPFPSKGYVRAAISLLRTYCKIRSCEDGFYRNRSRPCLEYQIGRCTAPCVGKVGEEDYAKQVQTARLILQGKSSNIISDLMEKMKRKSDLMDFEGAAKARDEIKAIAHIQSKISVVGGAGHYDLMECFNSDLLMVLSIVFYRDGEVAGSKSWNFDLMEGESEGDKIEQFIMQYGMDENIPKSNLLYVPKGIDGTEDIDFVRIQKSMETVGAGIKIMPSTKGQEDIANIAKKTAKATHKTLITDSKRQMLGIKQMERLFGIESLNSIECVDVSHTFGESTVGSLVMMGQRGFNKSRYRRYNIEGVNKGDDVGSIGHMMQRRIANKKHPLPDLLVVDGGTAQVGVVRDLIKTAQLKEGEKKPVVIGVKKGEGRREINDIVIDDTGASVNMSDYPYALYLIQKTRNEAHRFAIEGHRAKKTKAMVRSALDDIPGVGREKRVALLSYFGSVNNLKQAGIEQIMKVPGIGRGLANRIVEYFEINK